MSINHKPDGRQQESATPLLPFEVDQQPAPTASRRRARGSARHISEASLEVFDEIKLRRSRLYQPILEVLAERGPVTADCLTAREIMRELIEQDVLLPTAERNQVSPRLTELLGEGCVENPRADNGRIYLKRVRGDAPASVWRITPRGRAFLHYLQEQTPYHESEVEA